MKRLLIGIGAALALVGCTDRLGSHNGAEGSVVLGELTTDTKTEVVRVATKSDPLASDPTYRLAILQGADTIKTFTDYTTIGELKLQAGSYRFVVESGTKTVGAAIDAPYFCGEKTVTVKAGETVPVSLTAKLGNVRLSATMSQLIEDNFKEYSLSVHEVPLTKEDILAARSLYVGADQPTFTWILRLVNNQGTVFYFYQEVVGVVACSHYRFSFDIDQTAAEDQGQLLLNLTVETQVDHIEEEIDISLEQYPLPTAVAEGNFEPGKQLVVNEITRGVQLRVNLGSVAGIGQIKVRHTNSELILAGIPMVFEPTKLNASETAVIDAAGISWSPALKGQNSAWIDLSKLANKAPLGDYKFYITVEDQTKQRVDVLVHFVVLPDQDHITDTPEVGAKYALMHGEWCTLNRPEGLSFQYRVQGAAEWTMVDPSLVVDGANKAFWARVKGLSPTTSYEYRTYSPAAGEKQGNTVHFTTFAAPEIPNLSFDKAYYSGSYWYPNESGGNSYWATGNDGIVAGPVNMSPNNTEEVTDVIKGKAVRLKSVPIGFALSPVKFAGGSLFTGSYKTDMGNPINSVKFGRPYKGRPLALKGWYKYSPVTINNYKYDSDYWAIGTMDKCHIYISLEDWGGAGSRPDSPRVVGYGELKSDQKVSLWSEFRIEIDYKDPTRIPTHVVLVATASHLGGTFCGGNGSELMVDEFELVWE